jgi:hypothetical protein
MKSLVKNQAVKKVQLLGAREIDERRRTYAVRWSEAIERNEVDGLFSRACKGSALEPLAHLLQSR